MSRIRSIRIQSAVNAIPAIIGPRAGLARSAFRVRLPPFRPGHLLDASRINLIRTPSVVTPIPAASTPFVEEEL